MTDKEKFSANVCWWCGIGIAIIIIIALFRSGCQPAIACKAPHTSESIVSSPLPLMTKTSLRATTELAGFFENELEIITKAAGRNNCFDDDFLILLAIRKAENGRVGCEFGVKGKAWNTNLDTQAGWAAATVVKNRARWNKTKKDKVFIDYLADRYCPSIVDPIGNVNWKKNVKFWFRRLKNE